MGKTNGFLSFANTFPTEQSCIEYYEQIRWNGKVVSPFDESSKVYKCKSGKYRCANTGRYFDVKTGTVFAHTKLPLRYWFYAMFLFLSHKRGVSSCQLARDLGITQKTAWNILQKIRILFKPDDSVALEGEVECDEMYLGGVQGSWWHHSKRELHFCNSLLFYIL